MVSVSTMDGMYIYQMGTNTFLWTNGFDIISFATFLLDDSHYNVLKNTPCNFYCEEIEENIFFTAQYQVRPQRYATPPLLATRVLIFVTFISMILNFLFFIYES